VSTALVEEELRRFLESKDPEVLCIHGKWGVGKTFIWNALLRAAASERKIGLEWYAYVSLFGITSLDRLKQAIAENLIETRNIGKGLDAEVTRNNFVVKADQWLRENASWIFEKFGGESFASMVERLAYLSVTKTLVCIDDLERKGDSLAVKDVLGLVAQLRDQRSCKVILIFNDDVLEGENKKQYQLLSEKVVDASIAFDPDAIDCARIALVGDAPTTALLRERVIELGVSNIRIIKKIERLALRAAPWFETMHPRVLHQAVHSLALLGWSFYAKEEAPNLEFLLEKRGKVFDLGDGPDIPEQEKRWNDILDRYEFGTADDFDLALLNGVRRGFFDRANLLDEAKKLNDMFEAADGEKTLEAAWRPFHDSFKTNDDEVINGIVTAFRDNLQRITPKSLNTIVKLLKESDRPEQATEALHYYMENRKAPAEFFELRRHPFSDDVDDPDVRNAFDKKYRSEKKIPSASAVLLRIYENDSWSEDDMALLSEQSADDFYRMFKSQDGANLSRLVRMCLQFERIGDGGDGKREISAKAKEALVRIGRESPLNRRRVKKFGIKVE